MKTYRFKHGRNCQGYGYYAYISTNGDLVVGEDWGREGGDVFTGPYSKAAAILAKLQKYSPDLHDEIVGYYQTKADFEQLKKDMSFDETTKTILFRVKIYNKNGHVHNCLVRGRFQADVITKLMPQVSEVLTIQTVNADVFAIRSDEIAAVEFLEN